MVKYHEIIPKSCMWKTTEIPKYDFPRAREYLKIKPWQYQVLVFKQCSKIQKTSTWYWNGFILRYYFTLGITWFGIVVPFHIQDFGMISWYFTIYYWATKGTFWSLLFAQVIPKFGIPVLFTPARVEFISCIDKQTLTVSSKS